MIVNIGKDFLKTMLLVTLMMIVFLDVIAKELPLLNKVGKLLKMKIGNIEIKLLYQPI